MLKGEPDPARGGQTGGRLRVSSLKQCWKHSHLSATFGLRRQMYLQSAAGQKKPAGNAQCCRPTRFKISAARFPLNVKFQLKAVGFKLCRSSGQWAVYTASQKVECVERLMLLPKLVLLPVQHLAQGHDSCASACCGLCRGSSSSQSSSYIAGLCECDDVFMNA